MSPYASPRVMFHLLLHCDQNVVLSVARTGDRDGEVKGHRVGLKGVQSGFEGRLHERLVFALSLILFGLVCIGGRMLLFWVPWRHNRSF
jgi:hypothetical protein